MSHKLFVNLPIKSLSKTVAFFTELGFQFNPQFTSENTTCMLIGTDAFAMLLEEARFKDFIKKQICDTRTHTEVLLALSVDSRAEVDAMVHKALAAGGSPAHDPQDHGFMYGWSFQDLDGHIWEVFWMDPAAVQPQ